MTDKQPQTCYVPDKDGEFMMRPSFGFRWETHTNITELPDRYIFTKEELEERDSEFKKEFDRLNEFHDNEVEKLESKIKDMEEKKIEWMREAAEKMASHFFGVMKGELHIQKYIDIHYPITQ